MLEVQHQQQLLNNNWFAKLPQAYQQYIVQHAKYIRLQKTKLFFALEIYLMASMQS
jgi:TRAP-type C4-dicarboxylate transport system substrate-binding protein